LKSLHFGIGARSGFSGFAGTDGDEWDVKDMTWDNDVYIPVRLTDNLTLYGGIGVTLHDCEYEGLVQSESYSRRGRSWRYTYSLKTVRYSHGACADTSYWFGGLRFRPAENFFVFGEYRRTSGTLDMETGDLPSSSKYKTLEADFEGNCFVAGVGVLF
jgi:opacity protein-like surface antigen